MSEHTPWPWKLIEDTTCRPWMTSSFQVVAPGTTEDRVRPIARLELQGKEAKANGNLIAAAPEMLEALEILLKIVEREEIQMVWPADHACAECRPNSEIIVDGFKCGRHAAKAAIAKAKGAQDGMH